MINEYLNLTNDKKEQDRDTKQDELYFISETPIQVIKEYSVYLHGHIELPHEYVDLIHLFQNANEQDRIVLYLSSWGGYISTTEIILNAMNSCKAHIQGVITSTIASACTYIALNCDSLIVEDFSEMMFHNYSGSTRGKGGEMKANVEASEAKLNHLNDKFYKGFLTDDELVDLKKGQDFWFLKDEIETRLMSRMEYLTKLKENKEKEHKALEQANTTEEPSTPSNTTKKKVGRPKKKTTK